MAERIELTVNGQRVAETVGTDELLLDFLRRRLGLTGTKEACGIGVCGLCTVWVDGKTVSACLMPAVFADGAQVYTVEGLPGRQAQGAAAPAGAPDPRLWAIVQDSFVECEGLQCGICTPGQVMSALSLLSENPNPTEAEIRHHMAGNLCRCTGYQSIVRAVQRAAERWRAEHATV